MSYEDKSLSTVREYIDNSKTILIISHIEPDGDAVGSVLGLYNFFQSFYGENSKDIELILPTSSSFLENLSFLPNYDKIKIFSNLSQEDKNKILSKKYDLFICLDFSDFSRITKEISDIIDFSKTIFIDHHDTTFFNFRFLYYLVVKELSSTCELIVSWFIPRLYPDVVLDSKAAVCFYTGILTDTGRFAYNKVNSYTHLTVYKLSKNSNIKVNVVNYYLFNKKSYDKLNFKFYMLRKKTKIDRKLKIAFLFYDLKTKLRYSDELFSVKEIISEVYGLEDSLYVFYLDERLSKRADGSEVVITRIGFRTITDFDLTKIAKLYNGGGHRAACGGYYEGDIYTTYKDIKKKLAIYKDEIKECNERFLKIY